MPHFHLSVQAGDDMILKRMKRRHLRAPHHRILRDRAPPEARCRVRRRPDCRLSRPRPRRWPRTHAALWTRPGSPISMSSPSAPDREHPPPACPSCPATSSKPAPRALRAKGEAARGGPFCRMHGHDADRCWSSRPGMGRTPSFAPVQVSGAAGAGQIRCRRASPVRPHQHLIGTPMRTFGEAPPPPTLMERLKSGLSRSTGSLGANLAGVFSKTKLDAETVANWKRR